jgi:hypothetical protein
MKLILTHNIPKEPGFYWYCNFAQHTPTVLEVILHHGQLWAENEELHFKVEKQNRKEILKKCRECGLESLDGFYYSEELWCRVPNPFLPKGKKPLTPNCY